MLFPVAIDRLIGRFLIVLGFKYITWYVVAI